MIFRHENQRWTKTAVKERQTKNWEVIMERVEARNDCQTEGNEGMVNAEEIWVSSK